MHLKPLILSSEFKLILEELESSQDHYFITGRAGTGKSTLLQLLRNTTQKRMAVLAPTGIAALNVRGQTIHSFFGFPPRLINKSEITPRRNRQLFKNLDTIIIDEISMVRADILDNIDHALRINRKSSLPFGGVQKIFFGDLLQLPPVISGQFEKKFFQTFYEGPYFFDSHIWEEANYRMIELTKVYRQSERRFIQLLDAIRTREMEYDDLELLNSRCIDIPPDLDYAITLSSINATANKLNEQKLRELDLPSVLYTGKSEGEFQMQQFPVDLHLSLKPGAQVMFVKNDLVDRHFVNGTIGRVETCTQDQIMVKIKTTEGEEKIVEVVKHDWEIIKYEVDKDNLHNIQPKVIGVYTHYPLKLAWAITIHKSQGKTFDEVIVDMGRGAFETGQTYVALSRCRTLDGIYLKQPIKPSDIKVDPRVVAFLEDANRH